jgi:hypothetical protein
LRPGLLAPPPPSPLSSASLSSRINEAGTLAGAHVIYALPRSVTLEPNLLGGKDGMLVRLHLLFLPSKVNGSELWIFRIAITFDQSAETFEEPFYCLNICCIGSTLCWFVQRSKLLLLL